MFGLSTQLINKGKLANVKRFDCFMVANLPLVITSFYNYVILTYHFQVIKNPVTDHFPTGCKKVGKFSRNMFLLQLYNLSILLLFFLVF